MSNNNIIISLCIPVYNNAQAAKKILDGLLISKNNNFEVIVCDDASTELIQ